ncbi:hypothetical protein SDC9_24663 [bioreactor metagenome]|uniref:Uncharacterized protein n=1 Tax=bioreactor metagenome TaxID=1076179 RepID=A0A644UJ16_9ZZZZ|nr:hypothetical protein [Desulfitobacterium hafniense]MEA5025954.1 hypothetical protein [Desulfitobacterium hafniense]
MDYTIGLIDEEDSHLGNIRRILLLNLPAGNTIDFKVYPLEGQSDILPKRVTDEVLYDIVQGNICSLIIDYKIMIHSALVEGTDIYKAIIDVVPKFPVVILTDVPSNCYEKSFVDADKVYWKKEFFKIEEGYSKEKAENIFRNMEHYVKQRAELLAKLEDHQERMTTEGFSLELYKEILNTEKSLDEFSPQGQTQIDKAISIDDFKEIVELLEKADDLLGDKHEK